MPVIAPPTLTAAGLSPDRADRATFVARSIARDDFIKNTQIPQLQAAISNVYNNALETFNNANATIGAASAATAATGVAKWMRDTIYAEGTNVWAPSNFLTYRRKVAGAGTTDPASDAANWALITTALDAYTKANILGTVSKVAGVPTGALIETITNSSGVAKRFADGTQICFGVFPDLAIGANVVALPVARTFSAAFAEAVPAVSYSFGLSLSTDFYGCIYENLNSVTQCQPAFRNGATAQSVVQIRYTAVGRWIL